MSEGTNRVKKSRLSSPLYRTKLGIELRQRRHELGYSLSDLTDMTTIPGNTILSLERGLTINIDYYVEFAKAVNYTLSTLKDFSIELGPLKELSPLKKERLFLTRMIREHIILSEFLLGGKTVEEILKELVRIKLIENNKVSSTNVSGVMRNFVKDETVRVIGKDGRKNIYELY